MKETKKKVLIVEDDLLITDSLEKLFSNGGYEIKTLAEGKTVEDLIFSWKPDVILLDIVLPDLDGVEIVKSVCSKDSGICHKILIMTTLNDSAYLAQAMEHGITNYVQKNTATPQSVFDLAVRMMK
jgi:DNA-binding response OmpR family regulator